ncbi:head decoration protein [Pelagibacterium nitratireducens]|uniref:Head decoration protein n=1 Tax=Pelagibacterium nitratireducens TaxID=1046114 RepID=A0ABZ2HUS3_9HYPH
MDIKHERPRNLGFVLSESSRTRSYETVTIAAGSGKLVPGTVLGMVTADETYTISANAEVVDSEGAETAKAILAYGVDATDDEVEALVMARDGEVKKLMLVFDDSVDDDTKIAAKHAQLAAIGIIVR